MWYSYSFGERELASKQSIWNEILMAVMQGCGIELYKPGTTSETFREGDTGHCIQDYSQGVIRNGAQPSTGDSITINKSFMVN